MSIFFASLEEFILYKPWATEEEAWEQHHEGEEEFVDHSNIFQV
jgi:hypothetical protein